jgi:hypothetical protein
MTGGFTALVTPVLGRLLPNLEQPFDGKAVAVHLGNVILVDLQIHNVDRGWHFLVPFGGPLDSYV